MPVWGQGHCRRRRFVLGSLKCGALVINRQTLPISPRPPFVWRDATRGGDDGWSARRSMRPPFSSSMATPEGCMGLGGRAGASGLVDMAVGKGLAKRFGGRRWR